MARPATKKETIKSDTIKNMRKLGTYKEEYEHIIDIYAETLAQYRILLKEFETKGCPYEVETGMGGSKKSPILATIEVLRKDLLAYSDRLCLNPKSIEAVTINAPKQSKLSAILSEYA